MKSSIISILFAILGFSCFAEDYSVDLRLRAEKGDEEAMLQLGYCYYYGRGISESKTFAYKWFEKSAIRGNKEAALCLGNCLEFGFGIEQDYKKAFDWYQRAITGDSILPTSVAYYGECIENFARNDFVPEVLRQEVLKKLSTMYYFGRGVKEDRGKAKEYAENIIRFGAFADESLAEWQEMILSPDVEE